VGPELLPKIPVRSAKYKVETNGTGGRRLQEGLASRKSLEAGRVEKEKDREPKKE